MLVILSGLPGTGKSTIGKAFVASRGATYVRVDEIEHALRQGADPSLGIGAAGYLVAFAIASSNLRLGNLVVADSVNPVWESREGWRNVARNLDLPYIDVELTCADPVEHRRRVETRAADIEGFELPTWEKVAGREYAPWAETGPGARLVLDTALMLPDEAVARIGARVDAMMA